MNVGAEVSETAALADGGQGVDADDENAIRRFGQELCNVCRKGSQANIARRQAEGQLVAVDRSLLDFPDVWRHKASLHIRAGAGAEDGVAHLMQIFGAVCSLCVHLTLYKVNLIFKVYRICPKKTACNALMRNGVDWLAKLAPSAPTYSPI